MKSTELANLENKLSPNQVAFLDASANGDTDRVRELLAKKVRVDAQDNREPPWNRTALMHAAWAAHVETVKLLLKHGADVLAKDLHLPESAGENQPIHYAASGGSVRVLELILAAGAYVNVLNNKRESPLIFAVRRNHLAATRFLVERGAHINPPKGKLEQRTPLCEAALAQNIEIIQYLLSKKADVNATDELDAAPLDRAIAGQEKGALAAVKALLAAGAKVDHMNRLGNTAISKSVFLRHFKILNLLIKFGADVNLFYKKHDGTLLDAALARIEANQSMIDDKSSADWERKAGKDGVTHWELVKRLLRKAGAKRQSKL